MDYYNYGIGGLNPVYGGQYPQYSNQYYQPQPQMNNCQCDNRFMWIQGKEAAKAYPVAPDKTIFFLDDKESYAYLKKTDKDGKTSEFKVFQLIEEKEPEPQPVPSNDSYISKDEFNVFSKNIDTSLNELKEMILSTQRHNNKPYKKEGRENG